MTIAAFVDLDARAAEFQDSTVVTEDSRKILFGQTATSVH
jgi:hypothetical protein